MLPTPAEQTESATEAGETLDEAGALHVTLPASSLPAATAAPPSPASPAFTSTDELRPTPRLFGLQRLFDLTCGGETYDDLIVILSTKTSADVAELERLIASKSWVAAQQLSHKVKGGLLALELDCAADLVALESALKDVVGSANDPELVRELHAAFQSSFGDLMDSN